MDQQQLADLQVQAARIRLTARLAELENRVVGATTRTIENVEEVSDHLRAMVTDTSSGIRDACTNVASNVCETFAIPRVVRDHPWQSLGLAVAVGLLFGLMPRRTSKSTTATAQPRIFADLLAVLRREAVLIGESAIAASAAAIKQKLAAPEPSAVGRVSIHAPRTNGRHKVTIEDR